MIYLAILLILCGLLILIAALSIETGRITESGELKPRESVKAAGSPTEKSYSDDFPYDEIEIIFPGDRIEEKKNDFDKDDIFISFDDESAELSDPEQFSEYDDHSRSGRIIPENDEIIQNDRRRLDSHGRPEIIEKRENKTLADIPENGSVTAIMFDDRSNIIDYESGSGVIDSTFSKYKSIKRIGKGRIESDYDGVNFYLDERLYRFDFHKVYDIWSGSNYIALPLKGNSTVKLFIIENSAGFPEEVEANFKEYEKGL